jgi:hypothetical protein
MPMTFPSHQGLILPVARKWPNSFDALALSVGAAMPDITDTVLGFLINGYFKQWYGHALIGTFTLDLLGGLCITRLIAVVAKRLSKFTDFSPRLQRFLRKAPPISNPAEAGDSSHRAQLSLWSFSILVGILSHVGFDLISHDINLLFYPWHENVHWFPEWWYRIWFEIRPLPMFGHSYSVGVHSVIWGVLTFIGIILFFQFLGRKENETESP